MFELKFTKMQGLGNDFIVIDDLLKSVTKGILFSPQDAVKICDRRFGVGADQILWLKKSKSSECDARMEILNADGSWAEMCGNGIRAVALYLKTYAQNKQDGYRIETPAGIKRVQVVGDEIQVDMGAPVFAGRELQAETIQVLDRPFEFYSVSMGNPHAVIFVEDLKSFPVETYGPQIETHSRFPKRTNVEFVQITDPHSLRVRVWERGAGVTLACGTGACASAVAALATQRVRGVLKVSLPGGDLKISWAGPNHSVLMQGPATEVFQGIFYLHSDS